LMRPELDAQDFVKFNYWDSGRKGLLSGDTLYLDLKRMEMAYLENNTRELELTRPRVATSARSTRAPDAEIDRYVYHDDPGVAVRPGLPRPLHAPNQDRCALHPLCRRSVHERQLHVVAPRKQPADVADARQR